MIPSDVDVVVVGGGSGGCVTANRLSADPACRVLLVEAGVDTPPGQVPDAILDSYPMPLFHGTRYLWPHLTVGFNTRADGSLRSRFYEQGRVMGGSSSVNVQAANRGLPRDYETWKALGCTGWGWNDVLPYFKKLECDADCEGPLHGKDGPLHIRRILAEGWGAYGDAVTNAFVGGGYAKKIDQNGDFEDGVFPPAFSNFDDRRVSAAAAYLDYTVRRRPNLTICAETQVIALLTEGPRVVGVRLRRKDKSIRNVHGRTVVVCAGALQTPGILMRAGIGPGADLQRLGIEVVADRPGVGANLRDHPGLMVCQYLPRHLRLAPTVRRSNFAVLRYSSALPGGSPSDMYVSASARAGWHAVGARLAVYFLWCNQPHSVGYLALKSADPDSVADINLNLLGDDRDLARICAGVRKLVSLVMVPDLNPDPNELFPTAYTPAVRRLSIVSRRNRYAAEVLGRLLDGPAELRHWMFRTFNLGKRLVDLVADDAALTGFVRDNIACIWHASGTCRMGSADDPTAVVDPSGRVLGVDGLYVADASVMPRLPTANTNVPTIMLAEKIADGLTRRLAG